MLIAETLRKTRRKRSAVPNLFVQDCGCPRLLTVRLIIIQGRFQGPRFKVFIHHKYNYIVHNTFINLYNYSKNGEEVHIETIKAY